MKTTLHSHIQDDVLKEEFKNMVRASKPVLDRVINIMNDKIKHLEKDQEALDNYDSPNWAYKQIDYNSTKRAYKHIINLLEIK